MKYIRNRLTVLKTVLDEGRYSNSIPNSYSHVKNPAAEDSVRNATTLDSVTHESCSEMWKVECMYVYMGAS